MSKRWLWIASVAGVAAIVAIWWIAIGHAQVNAWLEHRTLISAQAFLRQNDLRAASLSARQVLQRNPHQVEACSVMVEVYDRINSPQCLTFSRRIAEAEPGNLQSALNYAIKALEYGETFSAGEALRRLPTAAQGRPDVLILRGATAAADGAIREAEKFYAEAAELDPQNHQLALNREILRLQSTDPTVLATARQTLRKLAEQPDSRLGALRALLADARKFRAGDDSLSIAREVMGVDSHQFSDELALLEEERWHAPAFFPIHLAKLRERLRSPAQLMGSYLLANWLNGHGLFVESEKLINELPAAAQSQVPIPSARAEALVGKQDWEALRALVNHGNWGVMESVRCAFEVLALERLDLARSRRADKWEAALLATNGDWEELSILAKLAERLGWKARAAEVWWVVARQKEGQRFALKHLYRIYADAKNTPDLLRVAGRILELEPNNPIAMNNVASLQLLRNENVLDSVKLAKTVYEQYPSIPEFGATYALGLLKTHAAPQAEKVMNQVPFNAPEKAAVDACRGLVLDAVGEHQRAEPYLRRSLGSSGLLPEEVQLVKEALRL